MKQFRSILALAVIAASATASISPAQAIPLDEVLDSAGKSFVRGMFGISGERQESSQSGGFNNDKPQTQATPANPVPQQNNYSNPNQSASQQPSSPGQQQNSQRPAIKCISANGNNADNIDRDSPESTISVGRRLIRVSSRANIEVGYYGGRSFEKTCRILRHPSSEKINIGVAIADNSSLASARVSIYVAGQEKISGVLYAGQARVITIDVSGAESFAVVLKPLEGGGYIYPLTVRQP